MRCLCRITQIGTHCGGLNRKLAESRGSCSPSWPDSSLRGGAAASCHSGCLCLHSQRSLVTVTFGHLRARLPGDEQLTSPSPRHLCPCPIQRDTQEGRASPLWYRTPLCLSTFLEDNQTIRDCPSSSPASLGLCNLCPFMCILKPTLCVVLEFVPNSGIWQVKKIRLRPT